MQKNDENSKLEIENTKKDLLDKLQNKELDAAANIKDLQKQLAAQQ